MMLTAWVLAATHCAMAATYSVKDLGLLTDLPGENKSLPEAINSSGKVAGANVTNGAYRALLYGGSWTNLGTLGGGESFASGLADAGLVVGNSLTTNGINHAFLWTPGGTNGVSTNPQMKDLGALTGGTNSEAYGINGSGQICGFADTKTQGMVRQHAFEYSGGTMTDIGKLLGGGLVHSYGYGINDRGHIAGTAYDALYTYPHAFFYNGTTAVEIGDQGRLGSEGLALNNSDQIAGYLTTTNSFDHAFRYAAGVMTDLGTLGGSYSYAIGMNNSNVIVGGAFVDADNSIYHAFIAVSNTLVDLNGLLDASGAGWTLTEARAINDAGQIAGVGTYGGQTRAFLLTPTPPAPVITGIRLSGSDVLVSFTTIGGASYNLAGRDNVASGVWINLVTGISGTGGTVTATNTGALALPKRFYRAQLNLP